MHSASIFNQEEIFSVAQSQVETLKQQSLLAPRQVMRICLHSSPKAALHEMLIVHQQSAYVRPHKHLNKSESFHVIEGELDVFIFDDNGQVIKRLSMGEYRSNKLFCYRLSVPLFHTVLPM